MKGQEILIPTDPFKRPNVIVVDSLKGGIGDVGEQHVGNIGNANNINAPLAPTPFPGPTSSVWGDPRVIPPNSTRSVILQARSRAPGNPRSLLVSLNPPQIQQVNDDTAEDLDLKCVITYGVGGNNNEVIIDLVQGTQFTVAASHLQIEALYTLLSGGPAPPVRAGACLGYGVRAGGIAPTFTGRFIIGTAPSPTNIAFFMPDFAREVTVYTTVAQAISISFLSYSGATLATVVQAANVVQTLKIPNGTAAVSLSNPGPAAQNGTIQWGLGL